MSFKLEVFRPSEYASAVVDIITEHLPATGGSLVLTGGTTAKKVYPLLAPADGPMLGSLEILFSDERCVPPDHKESNYKMATTLLFGGGTLIELTPGQTVRSIQAPPGLHRMRGEDPPEQAAASYSEEIAEIVDTGLDLMLLGMGADAHVGAMFPNSPALAETQQLCRAVDRPDGMQGLTLTPPAMLSAKKVLLLVTGEAKAATVKRVLQGNEPIESCPARLLADHPDVTFLLDEPSASVL